LKHQKILELLIALGLAAVSILLLRLLIMSDVQGAERLDYLASADCNQAPANQPTSSIYNLDETAEDWGVFCEGLPNWSKENVTTPTIDGKSLRLSLTGGNSYSNAHFYNHFPSDPTANEFRLSLNFFFSPTTTFNNEGGLSTIQALEFTMNKWYQGKRYEWAWQWRNVGTGAPQWCYWDPHQIEPWICPGITATLVTLAGQQWHSLIMEGKSNNKEQLQYTNFMIDTSSHALDITVEPTTISGEPDRLAIAVQLDGNATQSPYDVYVDQVTFTRGTVDMAFNRIFLPVILR